MSRKQLQSMPVMGRALQAIEDAHHGTVFSIFESAEDQRKMIVYYVEDRTDVRA